MKDDFIFNVLVFSFSVLLSYIIFTNMKFHFIHKDYWQCTKSRMIDPNNVDKIECINYSKKVDENVP